MDTLLSQPASAPLVTTYFTCSTPLDLAESFLRSSSFAPIDPLDMSATPNCSPPSKKRKSITDSIPYQEQLAVSQSRWMQLSDASSHINSTESLPQWSNRNYSLINGNLNVDNHASVRTAEKFNDLEDVLNFLWMEDDTASTAQSDGSLHQSSNYQYFPSLLRELDWEHCSNESSSNLIGESSSEDPLGWDVIEEGTSSKQDYNSQQSSDVERISWHNTQGETRASAGQLQSAGESSRGSWQQRPLQAGVRASWQDGVTRTSSWQGGIRASWQDETRASWQERGGRASWQSKQAEGGSTSWPAQTRRAVPSDQSAGRGPSSYNPVWAGPTLLDIESALALSDCSNSSSMSTLINPRSGPPTPSSLSKQIILPFLDLKTILSEGEARNQASQSSSWRLKLQKRNSLEPKHTIKAESEEKALGDGYRWRKYGQKSIKNSPFPRSYYRCSTGKCSAKKQIEKCQDEGLFLVTYEGIHLHHKPNMLHKFRMPGDVLEDEKEKSTSHETLKSPSSPSSSTSCSHSIHPPN